MQKLRPLDVLALGCLGVAVAGCGADTEPMTTAASAVGTLPPRVQELTRAFTASMHQCSDRVWPGISSAYRSSQILLASRTSETAYVFNDRQAGGATSTISTAGLESRWFSMYSTALYNGTPTLGISLDITQQRNELYASAGAPLWHDFAIGLTFHEAFHILSGQSSWAPIPNTSRFLPYPQRWQPRYWNRMLRGALYDIARGTGTANLAAAAYWRQTHAQEFGSELAGTRAMEVYEGSAEYVELMSQSVLDRGCGASEADVIGDAVAHLDEFIPLANYNPQGEPYQLGVLAGLLLRQHRPSTWEPRVVAGTPPVEILLEGVTPVEQPDDAIVLADVQAKIGAENARVASEVDPMLQRMASAEHYRMVLPMRWVAGSYGLEGFFRLVDQPGQPDVLLRYSSRYQTPSGAALEVIKHTSIDAMRTPTPCGNEPSVIVTIPRSEITSANGSFSSTSAQVKLTNLPASVVMQGDLPWLCPIVPQVDDSSVPLPNMMPAIDPRIEHAAHELHFSDRAQHQR